MKVDFYRHGLSRADCAAIGDVLDTPFLTSGAVGKAVEAQLCEFFDVPHALLVNSWTNGALATLLAMDIGPGDEVIVPAMTFIATANVAELLGARAVFVDVSPRTLLLEPHAAEAAITPRTKAIIPVHLYGQMCDMAGFSALQARHPHVRLIEDCAHCFEGRRDGYGPGTHSDAALFSFYATKNITCGEGGAFVTRLPELAATVAKTRLHGMSAGAADRYKAGGYRHWDMERMGMKANLPDLLAALLPAQITRARDQLLHRERIAQAYLEACDKLGVRTPETEPGVTHARHLFPIHVDPQHRDAFISGFNSRGIGVAVNYRSILTTTYYGGRNGHQSTDFPVAHAWGEGTITLPLYPTMSDAALRTVIDVLGDLVAEHS